MQYWWEPPCQMAPSEDGNSVLVDWENEESITINLAVYG